MSIFPFFTSARRPVLLAGALLLLISSCKKDDYNYKDAGELQKDDKVSQVQKEGFINRVYIDLLGRKPGAGEMDTALADLSVDNASAAQRTLIVNRLLANPEFFDRVYIFAKAEYLNSTEDSDIGDERANLVYARGIAAANNQTAYVLYYDAEIAKLDSLTAIPTQMKAGQLDFRNMHKRMVNNMIYDQINMGVANFTFSVFESFLFRQPTDAEWASSQDMCNNIKATLFNRQGTNKPDFIDIVFDDIAYYEGQVTTAYLRFHSHKPNSTELYEHTSALLANKDFLALYRNLLISDEYFF